MSPADLAYWQLAQRRAATLQPEIAAALLRAFAILRAQLSEVQLVRLIASGDADAVIRQVLSDPVLQAAFFPVREKIRSGIASGVRYASRALPIAPPPGVPPVPPSVTGTISGTFDVLNPKVIDAIRSLESRVITGLETDVRETVRALIENGLRDGSAPATIARDLRGMIGLGPSQLQEVENFRDALLGRNGRSIADYTLRDKRFDRTVQAALGPDGKGLSAKQVETMVARYRTRRIAQNAEMVSRTAAGDAQKLGQHLAYQNAVGNGTIDGARLVKRWVGVMDARERPLHVAQEGSTVPWDQPYPGTGEMIPGESTYNCRCISRYMLR